MTDLTAASAPSWSRVVDAHVRVLTAAPAALSAGTVAEAVETALSALAEAQRRDPDPFGWPAEATTWCLAAAGCYQEAAGWSVLQLPLPTGCRLEDTDLAELAAGVGRLLAAAHDATLALARAAATPRVALQLTDAAAALARTQLIPPSSS